MTSVNTLDNIRNIVGNSKIFGDVIQNFSTNAFRRVDLTAQLSHGVDPHQAIAVLQAGLKKIPNVVADPVPSVEILTFNLAGPVLAVRPSVPIGRSKRKSWLSERSLCLMVELS